MEEFRTEVFLGGEITQEHQTYDQIVYTVALTFSACRSEFMMLEESLDSFHLKTYQKLPHHFLSLSEVQKKGRACESVGKPSEWQEGTETE